MHCVQCVGRAKQQRLIPFARCHLPIGRHFPLLQGSATRYVVVYKGADNQQAQKAARKHPLSTLEFRAPQSVPLVDGFLDAFPLPPTFAAAASHTLDDTEVDLRALAAKYAPRRSAAETAALNAQLQKLQLTRAATQSATSASPDSMTPLQSFRTRLPIYAQKETILRMIDENQVLVLSSSTGTTLAQSGSSAARQAMCARAC